MSIPTTEDVFIYRTPDPHTAIPDWLAFCRTVSAEARNMAHAILVLSRKPLPPTRAEIAEALGVEVRTIQRWLGELRTAGILTEAAVGRRVLCIFSNPSNMGDQPIRGDRLVTRPTDHPTNRSPDPLVTHDPHDPDQFLAQQKAANGGFFENPISDPPLVGWLVDSTSLDSKKQPTKPERRHLKTRLSKWLRQHDMRGAHLFDNEALDFDLYTKDFLERRYNGTPIGSIVEIWLAAPLEAPALAETDPAAPVRVEHLTWEEDDKAEELAAQIDSTSIALARRFEQERQIAQQRGAGLLDERGKPR